MNINSTTANISSDVRYKESTQGHYYYVEPDNIVDNLMIEEKNFEDDFESEIEADVTGDFKNRVTDNQSQVTENKNFSRAYYTKTQKWIGHVINFNEKAFTARLIDLTIGGTDEIGEFELDEISIDDIKLIKKGASFYWSIGYAHSLNGQVTKESLLRFQRVVDFTNDDIDEALDRANDMIKNIKWE